MPSGCRTARDGLYGERGVYATDGRENRPVADPEIWNVPAATIRIHDAIGWIAAHSRRSVEVAGVVVLRPQIPYVGGSQRPDHEFQRMIDQTLVIVAPGISDTGNSEPILVEFINKCDAVGFLRQHFADDLQTDHVVVIFHFRHQARAPKTMRAHLCIGPQLRQRALTHVAVAAKKILALVLVVPVLGDRQRRGSFVRANLAVHHAPHGLI